MFVNSPCYNPVLPVNRSVFQVCCLKFYICTLCTLFPDFATPVTLSVLVISSARLVCIHASHHLRTFSLIFKTPFAFHASRFLLVSEVKPPSDGRKFTTKVRHFHRLNHRGSEYWPSFNHRLWTFPDYMVSPQRFPGKTVKTWGPPEVFHNIYVWLCVCMYACVEFFFSFQNNPVIFH